MPKIVLSRAHVYTRRPLCTGRVAVMNGEVCRSMSTKYVSSSGVAGSIFSRQFGSCGWVARSLRDPMSPRITSVSANRANGAEREHRALRIVSALVVVISAWFVASNRATYISLSTNSGLLA